MNESLLIRFESEGNPLTVKSFTQEDGLMFDRHRDASPLTIAVGILPVMPGHLDNLRRIHDWREKQFKLDGALESGGIRLSGFNKDPNGLPPGAYDLTVEVEAYKFKNSGQRIFIREGAQAVMTLREEPDRRRVRLVDGIDPITEQVLDHPLSVVDGAPLRDWLKDILPRPARQACLLNLLAKLRVPAAPELGIPEPLAASVDSIYFADVDRVYAAMKPGTEAILKRLTEKKMWVCEGAPKAKIHMRVLDRLPADEREKYTDQMVSYRQGGRNCLQLVLTIPKDNLNPQPCYADIDIDLGNPLWDAEGLIVHMGEILDSGRTDHLKLRKAMVGSTAKDFLYYEIDEAAKAAGK